MQEQQKAPGNLGVLNQVGKKTVIAVGGLGKGSKTPIAALCRYGGGVPPLAVFFFGYFFGRSGAVMGGGYPPLP